MAAIRTLGRIRRRPRVFVSYRRSDGGYAAARLHEKLKLHFDLFWDIEGIGPGKDFRLAIQTAVEGSDQVLVLLTPQWAAERDELKRRRIDDPADWVAHEIAAGLRRGVVMPVLIDDTHMPERSELPPHISALSDLNALTVRLASFDDDVARLRRAIWEAVAPPPWPVWRKAVLSVVLVAAVVLGIVFATRGPGPDPSTLRVGQSVTFQYQRVTVSDVRLDALYGQVVEAQVCVVKLAGSATESNKLSWAAWSVVDSAGTTHAPTWSKASTPAAIYPKTGKYAVGQCARGLIPFDDVARDRTITKVLYLGKEDQASWTP